jgi:hypothetical protein
MTVDDNDYREKLAVEAARVRDSGDLGRSEPLIRLFDFLLQRSLAGRVPKEIEIAQEVFDKSTDFDMMLDASVRVYIHRLRRKLSEHYTRAPIEADRISIPLGEYRLVLATAAAAVVVEDEGEHVPDPPVDVAPPAPRRIGRIWLIVIAFALINALGWAYYIGRLPTEVRPMLTKLWRPIVQNKRPTAIALGDYYIFGESDNNVTVPRLVRDFTINSRGDLDSYLMLNPDKVGRYVDLDLNYLPTGLGPALGSLIPVVNAAAHPSGIRARIANMSDLEPDIFKNVNIVYVGFLSGLGPLQAPLFRASGFKVGNDFDELIDKASGRRFKSDWGSVVDGKVPQRDYGYIASLPGPAGNRIIIIAGTRDPAVVQMAEVAADEQQLDMIDAKNGDGAFEALFEVRTLGNLNLGSSLVLVRPIRADRIWQPDRRNSADD